MVTTEQWDAFLVAPSAKEKGWLFKIPLNQLAKLRLNQTRYRRPKLGEASKCKIHPVKYLLFLKGRILFLIILFAHLQFLV